MFVNHIKNYLTTTTYNNLYDLKTKLTMHVLPPHNPKVGGSNPSRATNLERALLKARPFFFFRFKQGRSKHHVLDCGRSTKVNPGGSGAQSRCQQQ